MGLQSGRASQARGRGRLFVGLISLVVAVTVLGGCQPRDIVQDVINQVGQTRQTIEGISNSWRDELPKLVASVQGLESQAAGDAKSLVAETTNQLQDLSSQTIQLSDAVAQDLIAQAGVEFRCNANFVKNGVADQLQHIVDDLTFWKQTQGHLSTKPIHNVCWINPTVLSLYPSGSGWSIDTSNMNDAHVMHVFGYNFRSDAMPVIELQNATGQTMRPANVTASYVTQYQANIDFSSEDFNGVANGARLVFDWPDFDEGNTVNLTLHPPAALRISNPVFNPPTPQAGVNGVTLTVTITNEGGTRSGNFIVNWKPDPNDMLIRSIDRLPMNPGQSTQVSFPSYTYTHGGQIDSTVSLNNGDDSKTYSVTVSDPPHVPAPERDLPGFPIEQETVYGNYVGGMGRDSEYGGNCSPGYVRSSADVIIKSVSGRATAWSLGWSDPNNPHSCLFKVHYSVDASFPSPNANWVQVKLIIKEKGE